MIQQIPLEGFTNIVHTYSDSGFKILQVETGIIYDAADDAIPCRYTYEETDIPIEHEVEEEPTTEEV